MTKRAAVERARVLAKRHQRDYFVVWSVEESDGPREHYHPASEDDADTYYGGCEVVLSVQPDGTIEA